MNDLRYYTEEELKTLKGRRFVVNTGLVVREMLLDDEGKVFHPITVGHPTKAQTVKCKVIELK